MYGTGLGGQRWSAGTGELGGTSSAYTHFEGEPAGKGERKNTELGASLNSVCAYVKKKEIIFSSLYSI